MNMKRFACGAMAAALLSLPALAAGEEPTEYQPIRPIGGTINTAQPEFSLSQWKMLFPEYVYGKTEGLSETRLTLKNSSESDPLSTVVLNIGEKTLIVDAVTGEAKTMADIQEGESLTAWISPAMTRSLPPQSAAQVILCNIPADYMPPTYSEVQKATAGEDGKISLLTSDDMVLHLDANTALTAFRTKNVAALEDIQPGTRILAWYSVVMESYPAQATPAKVMVLPTEYDGWFAARALDELVVNGETVEAAGYAEEGKLMVPVRALAEALGCQVTWNVETPDKVGVEKNGETLYELTIGEEGAVAKEGVTYMSADTFVTNHNLKVEGRWPSLI